MRALRFFPIILLIVPFSGATWAQQDDSKLTTTSGQQQTTDTLEDKSPVGRISSDKLKVVYVSDFELHAVTDTDDKKTVGPVSASDSKKGDKLEEPAEQASRLVDLMSTTLIKELQKAGYTVHRKLPGDARHSEGLEIHGIFAETDEQNRLRRAVIGNDAGNAKMELFVGVENLARPEQPLYTVADPRSNERMQGPVITVSAYAPVAKFELDKNASEKAINDTAATIVADLDSLLNANVAALMK